MLRRLTPAIHKLDDALARLDPVRDVLFELRTPVYQAVLGPVSEALASRSGLRVWHTSEYPDRIAPLVPRGTFLTHREVEWRHFDLYANGDPWAAARLRRCSHRINFFHGVAGKYDLDTPAGLPMGFEYYDRVAFINRDRMQRYLYAAIVTPAQAVLLGYPKLDRLANGGWDAARIRAQAGLLDDRPTVLYAPTYSTASSLHLAGEAIVSSLAASGFNVLVKLHDRSLDADPRYTGGIDWRARMGALEQPGRVRFVEGADASPWLVAADLMVTDHSSIGFEYFVLDRPLIVFDAPDLAREARINPEKIALLRSAASVVSSADDLVQAAHAELADPARLSSVRKRVASELFHRPGTATERAVTLALGLLGRHSTARAAGADRAIAGRAG
jgi:hypothetical protein